MINYYSIMLIELKVKHVNWYLLATDLIQFKKI